MKSLKLEVGFNFFLQLIQFIFPFIVLVLASRSLTSSEFVEVASLTYLISLQITIIGFGFEQVCTRLIAQNELSLWGIIAGSVLKIQILLWVVTTVSLVIFYHLTGGLGFIIYASAASALAFAVAPPWLAMALGLNQKLIYFNAFIRVLVLAIVFVLPPSVLIYSTAIIAVSIASSIFFFFVMKQTSLELKITTLSDSVKYFRSLWTEITVAFLAKLGVLGYTAFIPLSLSAVADSKLTQIYMVSDKFRNIIQYSSGAFLPVFNRFYLEKKADRKKLEIIYFLGFVLLLLGCTLFIAIQEEIFSLLNLSLEGSHIFSILILSVLAIYLTNFFGVLKVFHSGHPFLYLLPLLVAGVVALISFSRVLEQYGVIGLAGLVLAIEFFILSAYLLFNIYITRVKK